MRFLRRLILLAGLAAGAAYVKQLLDDQQGASSTTQSSGTSTQSNGAGEATKAQLYEQAQKLGIEGRSKMTKSELERAIREAS